MSNDSRFVLDPETARKMVQHLWSLLRTRQRQTFHRPFICSKQLRKAYNHSFYCLIRLPAQQGLKQSAFTSVYLSENVVFTGYYTQSLYKANNRNGKTRTENNIVKRIMACRKCYYFRFAIAAYANCMNDYFQPRLDTCCLFPHNLRKDACDIAFYQFLSLSNSRRSIFARFKLRIN